MFDEITSALASAADGRQPAADTTFNKPGEEWVSYGLKAAVLRAAVLPFRADVRAMSLNDRLDLAARLLATHIGDVGHAGIWVLALSRDEIAPRDFPAIDRMLDDFRGWSHVDDLCIEVMQPLLARYPDPTLKLHDGWTRSPNKWKRRASVVTFVRKVGESGRYTNEVLGFSDRLVRDPEDLVLKGVGWALKDNMRSAPERVLAYVKDLRRRGISAVVTLYAIRDLDGASRADVLAVKAERA